MMIQVQNHLLNQLHFQKHLKITSHEIPKSEIAKRGNS